RRARALYGLGNCLLLRASGGPNPDAPTLRAAVKAYRQCLADGDAGPDLLADARHNLQRARLLLAQVAPSGEEPPEEDPPAHDRHRPDRPDQPPAPPERPGSRDGGTSDPHGTPVPVKPQPGD